MQLHTTRAAVRKRARYHLAAALFDKAPSAPARTGLRGNGRTRRRLGPQAAALTDKAPGPCSPVRQAPPFSKTEALCRPFAAGYSSLLSLFQNFLCFLYYRKPRRSCQVPKVARMRPPRASEHLPMHLNLPDSAHASGEALPPRRRCGCASSAPPALFLRPFFFQRFCLFTAFFGAKAGGPPALQRKSQKRYSPALRQAFFLWARPCIYKAAKTCYDESGAAGGGFFCGARLRARFQKAAARALPQVFLQKRGVLCF